MRKIIVVNQFEFPEHVWTWKVFSLKHFCFVVAFFIFLAQVFSSVVYPRML